MPWGFSAASVLIPPDFTVMFGSQGNIQKYIVIANGEIMNIYFINCEFYWTDGGRVNYFNVLSFSPVDYV